MIDWWLLACILAAFVAVRSLVQLAVQYYRVKYHFVLVSKQAELDSQLEHLRKLKAEEEAKKVIADVIAKNQEAAKNSSQVKSTSASPKKAA